MIEILQDRLKKIDTLLSEYPGLEQSVDLNTRLINQLIDTVRYLSYEVMMLSIRTPSIVKYSDKCQPTIRDLEKCKNGRRTNKS
jgi:hypothetical protein